MQSSAKTDPVPNVPTDTSSPTMEVVLQLVETATPTMTDQEPAPVVIQPSSYKTDNATFNSHQALNQIQIAKLIPETSANNAIPDTLCRMESAQSETHFVEQQILQGTVLLATLATLCKEPLVLSRFQETITPTVQASPMEHV